MSSELRVNKLTNTTGINTITFATDDATFSGNVSIAGTLTYVDLANIDAVGIITAQSDVSIADKIIHTGDTNTALRFPSADTFTVETAGSERIRITSAGLMGLGTASPAEKLDVAGNINLPNINTWIKGGGHSVLQVDAAITYLYGGTGGIQFRTADNASVIGSISNTGAATFNGDVISGGDAYNGANNGCRFYAPGQVLVSRTGATNTIFEGYTTGTTAPTSKITAAGAATFSSNMDIAGYIKKNTSAGALCTYIGDTYLRVYSSPSSLDDYKISLENTGAATFKGNVSIGGHSAARKFSVVDNAGSMVHFGISGTHGGYLGSTIASQAFLSAGSYYNGSNWVASDSYAENINMYYGTIRFCTDSSLTSGNTFTPTERMQITAGGALNIFCNSTSNTVLARHGAGSGGSYYMYLGYYSATSTANGTASYGVFTDGSVDGAANSYGGWSDVKLKENIVDAKSQWDDIKNLRVRNFNLKEGITKTQIGLIAQEAETVSPGLVFDTPDRDDDGNDLGTTTKSLRYSVLYMKAIKALQEAMTKIETLESKVSALESS